MQKPLRVAECPREEQMMRDEKCDPISSETQNWAWRQRKRRKKKKFKKESKDFIVFYWVNEWMEKKEKKSFMITK